jgi:hypothetical protein
MILSRAPTSMAARSRAGCSHPSLIARLDPSVVEFEAPTFRKGRERWCTPCSWRCRGARTGPELFSLRFWRSKLRDDVLLDGAIRRNDFPLDFGAGEGQQSISGVFAPIFQAPVFNTNPAQIPFLSNVGSADFVVVWVQTIFLKEECIDQVKCGVKVSGNHPIQVWGRVQVE